MTEEKFIAMSCPQCGNVLHCSCETCISKTRILLGNTFENLLHSVGDTDMQYCGNCGLLNHCDTWFMWMLEEKEVQE